MHIKDPVSALTHMLGAVLSVVGLVLLVYQSVVYGKPIHVAAFAVYGASMVLLYAASSLYHAVKASQRWTLVLRKIDHSMIYVLIAGTYTPLCLVALQGAWRWGLLVGIWSLALLGIAGKVFWFGLPRWVSTLLYGGMGWLVVIAIAPLLEAISLYGVVWLALGGVLYTVGAVIYGLKWPKLPWKTFGFHETFHIFVLAGSAAHFWMMERFVVALG